MTPPPAFSQELTDGILTIRLTRPEVRNAQGPAFWADLAAVGDSLDPAVRAIVLCAQGPSFSAGMDRRMLTSQGIPGQGSMIEFAQMDAQEFDDLIATFQKAFSWWSRCPVVTVAAVNGHAVGAGFQLALGCDVIVVADDVKFSMKEPSLGLVPDLAGTLPLVAAVGYPRAVELVVSGRWVEAEEAVRIGLALKSVPRDQLEDAAREVALSCARALPGAVSATKTLLRDAVVAPRTWAEAHEAQMAAERAAQVTRIRELAAMFAGSL